MPDARQQDILYHLKNSKITGMETAAELVCVQFARISVIGVQDIFVVFAKGGRGTIRNQLLKFAQRGGGWIDR